MTSSTPHPTHLDPIMAGNHSSQQPNPLRLFDCELIESSKAIVVRPTGELDLSTARELEAKLEQAAAQTPSLLVLDLAGLTFMDSTGLKLILTWTARAASDERLDFRCTFGQPAVERVFEVSGVDTVPRVKAEELELDSA